MLEGLWSVIMSWRKGVGGTGSPPSPTPSKSFWNLHPSYEALRAGGHGGTECQVLKDHLCAVDESSPSMGEGLGEEAQYTRAAERFLLVWRIPHHQAVLRVVTGQDSAGYLLSGKPACVTLV